MHPEAQAHRCLVRGGRAAGLGPHRTEGGGSARSLPTPTLGGVAKLQPPASNRRKECDADTHSIRRSSRSARMSSQ
jgi:hypothetical protein